MLQKKKMRQLPSKRPGIPSDTLCNISSAPISFFSIFFSLAHGPLQAQTKNTKTPNVCSRMHVGVSVLQKGKKIGEKPVNERNK
jgi:hypothetical protein